MRGTVSIARRRAGRRQRVPLRAVAVAAAAARAARPRNGRTRRRYLADALSIGDEPRFDDRRPSARGADRRGPASGARWCCVNDVAVASERRRGAPALRRAGRRAVCGRGRARRAGHRMSTCCRPRSGHADGSDARASPRASASRRVRAPGVRAVPRPAQRQLLRRRGCTSIRTVTASKDAQVLARFDAGLPALLERRVGTGRVLLWASALDQPSSDLPLNSRVSGLRPRRACATWRRTASRSRGSPWGRSWIRRRWSRKDRRRRASC